MTEPWVYRRCLVLHVVDGDTIDVEVDAGLDTFRRPIRVRLAGVDAPDWKHGRERRQAARAYALELCPPGARVTLTSLGWDKYGKPHPRVDGHIVLADGRDLGLALVEAGHAEFQT